MKRINSPRPIKSLKRPRRSRADVERIRNAMLEIFEIERPMTCRQMFYQLVSRGVIAKTELEYKATVIRLLGEMRLDRTIPFDWIADHTRWVRKARTHDSLSAMLDDCASTYRRHLWRTQPVYVEIWLEKDALAGVLSDVTYEWDVPLMVSRGYPSLSYLQSTAETLEAQDKPCYLYQFGDHDPSGVGIQQNIETRLRQFAPSAEIHFERVAVTESQIEDWNLPTRPTKATDTRARDFKGDSVDVDAIAPNELRKLCDTCISRHVDSTLLRQTRKIEKEERDSIHGIISLLSGNADDDDSSKNSSTAPF